jgi:hypothetical protein
MQRRDKPTACPVVFAYSLDDPRRQSSPQSLHLRPVPGLRELAKIRRRGSNCYQLVLVSNFTSERRSPGREFVKSLRSQPRIGENLAGESETKHRTITAADEGDVSLEQRCAVQSNACRCACTRTPAPPPLFMIR